MRSQDAFELDKRRFRSGVLESKNRIITRESRLNSGVCGWIRQWTLVWTLNFRLFSSPKRQWEQRSGILIENDCRATSLRKRHTERLSRTKRRPICCCQKHFRTIYRSTNYRHLSSRLDLSSFFSAGVHRFPIGRLDPEHSNWSLAKATLPSSLGFSKCASQFLRLKMR